MEVDHRAAPDREFVSGTDSGAAATGQHIVQFYEDDAPLFETLSRSMFDALADGDAAVVFATPAHREQLEHALRERGMDLEQMRAQGRYMAFDAAATLSRIMVEGVLDPARFDEIIGSTIADCAAAGRQVRVFGEMVSLLWRERWCEAALELEGLWNDLAKRRPFSLLCAYPISGFDSVSDGSAFGAICEMHARVVPAESYASQVGADQRLRVIAQLQQKSSALEAGIRERDQAVQELQTVYEIGRMLCSELDLEALLQALTDATTRLTRARFGAFFYNVSGDNGGHYRLFTLSGAPRSEFERFGLPRNTAIFAATFAGQGVVRLDDVQKDPRYGRNPPHQGMPVGHLPVRSYLAVPVIGRDGTVLGGLFWGHPDPGMFTAQAERIVVGLAAHAAIAIDNARAYEAERRARALAEAASRIKDEFLSIVSHELRTPLASMLGWVAVLQRSPSPEQASRALEAIERSGRVQSKLIEDLLDISRIVSGRMRLDLRLVDPPEIFRDALEAIRPVASAKGVRLQARFDPSARPVVGDTDRLQQIAWNLLSNAVKFTSGGGLVEVTLDRGDEDVKLVVSDTGRGISPELLPFVFERFRQSEQPEVRRTGGLGLGLAIVRHLVELHGGTVVAASEGEERGTTFTVTLPLVRLGSDVGEQHAERKGTLMGLRVLLVDAGVEPHALREILERFGAVVGVRTVEGSRESLFQHPPDLIVCDLTRHTDECYALIREMRNTQAVARLPAIAVAEPDVREQRSVRAAGFDMRLNKPVNPELLLAAVLKLVPSPEAGSPARSCSKDLQSDFDWT